MSAAVVAPGPHHLLAPVVVGACELDGMGAEPDRFRPSPPGFMPIEEARRTISSTTPVVSTVSGMPGRASCGGVGLFTSALVRYLVAVRAALLLRTGRPTSRSPEPGGEGGDVVVGDVKCPHPLRCHGAVDEHVAHTGGGVGDAVAFRPGIAGSLSEDHGGLGGFGQPQPDPDGDQLPHRQGVFGGVLHRGHHRDPHRAAL